MSARNLPMRSRHVSAKANGRSDITADVSTARGARTRCWPLRIDARSVKPAAAISASMGGAFGLDRGLPEEESVARARERPAEMAGAEGATAPETLRQKDRAARRHSGK